MKKWLAEDWEFTLTALEGEARHCRLGIEQGRQVCVPIRDARRFLPEGDDGDLHLVRGHPLRRRFHAERLRVQNRNGALVPLPLHSFPLVGPSRLTETKTENTENK